MNHWPHPILTRRAQAFDSHRPDLLGLRFRIPTQAGELGWQQRLKRKDPRDVARHWHDRDDTATQTVRGRVGPVVAHDDCWSPLVGLTAADRLKVGQAYLTAQHQ